jgi:transposase-like protein
LAAVKGDRNIANLAGEFGVRPNQNTKWKKKLPEGLPTLHTSGCIAPKTKACG